MSRLVTILAVIALAAVAPAAASDPVPTFKNQRTYFECTDQTVKVDNVHATAGTYATWSTTPPTGAFAGDGDGCGSVETTIRNYNGVALDTTFEGTFTGNMRDLTVVLHDLSHRADTVGPTLDLLVGLWVDGSPIVTDAPVKPTASSANSGVTHEFAFSITNLPFAVEHGNGTIERDVKIELRSRDAAFFAWGASEVPSGVHFNPFVLAPTRV